ncbi:integrase core domain protein [Ancylostoma ceylanicum]|uniref:Integrase core domain protein n=1 Tax=Ancylostoma ceylanicum TaxID=53326 RepID=A0A0D6M1Y8_9BILA|nr:integrase core domain protein [Ancylostoma ceylanicum]
MGLTSKGNRYIVTVIDHFTKYLGAYPVPDKKADTIAEVIFLDLPECILSDRGGEFDNAVIAALCEILQIKQDFTKGYCPRENGLTERANGTIVRMLKKKTVTPTKWDRILPSVVYEYNASPHAATAVNPHFLVYGYGPRYLSEIIPREPLSPYHVDYDNYKTEFLSGLTLAGACIEEHAKEYRAAMKQQYDRRMKTAASQVFNTGDRVYMAVPKKRKKKEKREVYTPKVGIRVEGAL